MGISQKNGTIREALKYLKFKKKQFLTFLTERDCSKERYVDFRRHSGIKKCLFFSLFTLVFLIDGDFSKAIRAASKYLKFFLKQFLTFLTERDCSKER